MARAELEACPSAVVVALVGDVPNLQPETSRALVEAHRHEGAACTILSMKVENPTGYGRIVRVGGKRVRAIVEEKLATPAQKKIREVSTGILCFSRQALLNHLGELSRDNAQKEYLLTDLIEIFNRHRLKVAAFEAPPGEAVGINDRAKILTPQVWTRFAQSHCGTVFADTQGIAGGVLNYSLADAMKKEAMTNFYDLGINAVQNSTTVNQVTLNQANDPRLLRDAIGRANAITPKPWGIVVRMNGQTVPAQTARGFKAGELYQTSQTPCFSCHLWLSGPPPGATPEQYEEFLLMHELLLHAYAAFEDTAIYSNPVNVANKLKFPTGPPNNWTADTAPTTYITDWISTDCTCTPGIDNNCPKNTARW